MNFTKVLFIGATICFFTYQQSVAQDIPADTTLADLDDFNFDELGNADNFVVKTYATQKVVRLSPTQLISVGYEAQLPFPISVDNNPEANVNKFRGLRLAFNAPVISRSSFILNLGLTYWDTNIGFENSTDPSLLRSLEKGLRTTGLNATLFKPLNDKHFIIVQANVDISGNYTGFSDLELGKSTTFSGIGIFGWKKDENTMFGVGVTRTYRAGQLLHIPAIYYNKTFNDKWGIESVVPAKIQVRRNFGPTSLLMFGYEIEGNAFYLNDAPGVVNGSGDIYIRRGELKPRVTYQKQVKNFVWLAAQAGLRYNWRFDGFSDQNPTGDNIPVFNNTLGNPLFLNISLNLVSP
jgi:hypothetical protein